MQISKMPLRSVVVVLEKDAPAVQMTVQEEQLTASDIEIAAEREWAPVEGSFRHVGLQTSIGPVEGAYEKVHNNLFLWGDISSPKMSGFFVGH